MATPLNEEEVKELIRANKLWDFVEKEGNVMDYRTLQSLRDYYNPNVSVFNMLSYRVPQNVKVDADSKSIHHLIDTENTQFEYLKRFVGLGPEHVAHQIDVHGMGGLAELPREVVAHPEVKQKILEIPERFRDGGPQSVATQAGHVASALGNFMTQEDADNLIGGLIRNGNMGPEYLSQALPQPWRNPQERPETYLRAVFNQALHHRQNFSFLSGMNYDDVGRLAADALKREGLSEQDKNYLTEHAIRYGNIGGMSKEALGEQIERAQSRGENFLYFRDALKKASADGKLPLETREHLHPLLSNDLKTAHWWYPMYAQGNDVEFGSDDAEKYFDSELTNGHQVWKDVPPEMMRNVSQDQLNSFIDRIHEEGKGLDKEEESHLKLLWHGMNAEGDKLDPDEYKEALNSHSGLLRLSKELRNKNGGRDIFNSPNTLERMLNHFRDHRERLMDLITHPLASPELLKKLKKDSRLFDVNDTNTYDTLDGGDIDYNDRERLARMVDGASQETIMGNYGLPVQVKVGSAALRQLRDHLQSEGRSMRPEELPKGRTWNSITKEIRDRNGNVNYTTDWNPIRDARGSLSHEKVAEYIDKMPSVSLRIVDDRQWHHPLQNHTDKPHNVLMHNITPETAQKLKDLNLWDSFIEMGDHADHNPVHPSSPWTLGWTRYHVDHKNKQIFIEEHQSDMYSYFRDHMKKDHLSPKQKENMQKTYNMLFADTHPSELIHESAMQYFRDQGFHDYEVQIHSVASKSGQVLSDKSKDAPAHIKNTYGVIPKKAGAVPSTYGSMDIQDDAGGDKLTGKPTHSHQVRKFEDVLMDLAKGEW